MPKRVTGITENMSKIGPKMDQKTVKKASKNRSEKQVGKRSKKYKKKGDENEEKSFAGSRIYRTLPGYYQKILQMDLKKGKVKCKGRVHANKQDRVHANKPQIPPNANTPWRPQAARGRISVACGNSSAPGPREESVRTERLQSNRRGCKMSKIHQNETKEAKVEPKT